jgi:hypothetical protein
MVEKVMSKISTSRLVRCFAGCCIVCCSDCDIAAVRRLHTVSRAARAEIRRHCDFHRPAIAGKLCVIDRGISPEFLWDSSRSLHDRIAGFLRFVGELLASRESLIKIRGKASTLSKRWHTTVRLHRDLKIVASGLTRFVNVAVQIDDAICEVKLTVSAYSFLRA